MGYVWERTDCATHAPSNPCALCCPCGFCRDPRAGSMNRLGGWLVLVIAATAAVIERVVWRRL